MPKAGRGPRLWLRPERKSGSGRVSHGAVWLIVDGRHQESTQCSRYDLGGAEAALERYINRKHAASARSCVRDPAEIPVADVLDLYAEHVAPKHARPKETAQRIERLAAHFTGTLAEINGDACRRFGQGRTPAARREDLSVLRAAINFHREEGHCDRIVSVALPDKNPGRDRWMTRGEAATLIWRAWRHREKQRGNITPRATRKHVARFILVGLYTGTRAGAVCAAALEPTDDCGFIDVERGVFYRRPQGAAETKKRRPPVPVPRRLLAHLRRWKRLGQRFGVEWNGAPVHDVDKAFRSNARDCGLPDVTPHVLRHTAATWLMQLGTDLWQAAGYLGMSVETLARNYGHHHPDYLRQARDAFDRPPIARQSNGRKTGEKDASNVRRIADVY